MIIGIGTDIVSVARIAEGIEIFGDTINSLILEQSSVLQRLSHGAVGRYVDVFILTIFDKFPLLEMRMDFDLIDVRFDSAAFEEFFKVANFVVGNSDRLQHALVVVILEDLPALASQPLICGV